MSAYREFLEAKVAVAPRFGFEVADAEVNPILKPHQRAIVRWMVAGGRRACFAAFGLGKTVIQLEAVRVTQSRAGGFLDACAYCAAAERDQSMPSLFDALDDRREAA